MPGGGRDPFAVQMSAAMQSCTMRTAANPDKHALHQAAQYKRVLPLVLVRNRVRESMRQTLRRLLFTSERGSALRESTGRMLKYLERMLEKIAVFGAGTACGGGAGGSGGGWGGSDETGRGPPVVCSGRGVYASLLIGTAALTAVAATDVKKADALPFSNAVIGNFLVSGNYSDNSAQFTIQYNVADNPGLYGNKVNLDNVNFGGNMNVTSADWNIIPNKNPNGSTNYNMRSNDNFENIRGPPFNFNFNYAPQNGFAVPSGIGNEALTDYLNLSIQDSFRTYTGQIAAPYSLTHAPSTPVPEPGTMALLTAGLLGLALYRKRKTNSI